MKKLFCLTVFSTAVQCFSQSYETKFIDPPLMIIDCESFITFSDFQKIESSTPLIFNIKTVHLIIRVSGIIDKSSSSQITISLDAKESLSNGMLIIASRDSQYVEYKMEGAGYGSYSGNFNADDNYVINTRFRIVAPGHPSYFLVLPLTLHLSRAGNNNCTHSFVNGTGWVYNAAKKKSKN